MSVIADLHAYMTFRCDMTGEPNDLTPRTISPNGSRKANASSLVLLCRVQPYCGTRSNPVYSPPGS